MRILIAEDDANLRRGLCDLLAIEGFCCVAAADGEAAWASFVSDPPDFCILDIMLPGMDGLDLCRAIRKVDVQVGILLLTARDQELDRVVGLENGADDYVAKPFHARELVARIRTIARRCLRPAAAAPAAGRFRMGDLEIDSQALRAFRGDAVIDLTRREVVLLTSLHAHAGRAMSRNDLFDLCWNRDYMPNSRALDQHISALRRKIEIDPGKPLIIRSVHGVGYRFDPPA